MPKVFILGDAIEPRECDNGPMIRRIGTVALLLAMAILAVAKTPAASPKEIAITIDDLPQNGREFGLAAMQKMTARLVKTVASHHIPAVGFVNEAQLYKPGEVDARIALLETWSKAGLELGNHTFAHKSFHETTLADFEDEVIRGETLTRTLDARNNVRLRYFRHPYLDTGGDATTRAAFEAFLANRGYTVAPVTLDAEDWLFNLVYADAKSRNDRETMKRVAEAYLAYEELAIERSEKYSDGLFHRQIRQVLLMHGNDLNADTFGETVRLFERHGYSFVTLERALEDPAYREPNTYAEPGGITWFDRWAFTRGVKIELPEIEPPAWIATEYERLDKTAPPRIPGSRN